MKLPESFNIYCDESCHLERDNIPVMALGAVWCPVDTSKLISIKVRELKARHGLSPRFEAKWTKISPAKVEFYLELVDLFIDDDRLRFRGLVIPDKSRLNHEAFGQTHDEWYYKMYFVMLQYIFASHNAYRIYLDIKDTQGGPKTKKLHEVLANKIHDFDCECITRVQQIRSNESEVLQLTDLLIGALTYSNRKLNTNIGKNAVVERLRSRFGAESLTKTSAFGRTKFNVLVWQGAGFN